MALHGTIQVNNRTIVHWEAVRQEGYVDLGHYRYKCKVDRATLPLSRGNFKTVTFELVHRYADGAMVLASRVLHEADRELARVSPPDEERGMED